MNNHPRVRDIVRGPPIVLSEGMDIRRAVQVLLDEDISGAPVVDAAGGLVGILTERDCIRVAVAAGYYDEPGGPVADFMSGEVETVSPDLALLDLAQRFVGSPYRRFPVLEDGRLVGLIGRRDVLRAIHGLPTWQGP